MTRFNVYGDLIFDGRYGGVDDAPTDWTQLPDGFEPGELDRNGGDPNYHEDTVLHDQQLQEMTDASSVDGQAGDGDQGGCQRTEDAAEGGDDSAGTRKTSCDWFSGVRGRRKDKARG